MVRPQRLFLDGEGAPIRRLGLVVAALVS